MVFLALVLAHLASSGVRAEPVCVDNFARDYATDCENEATPERSHPETETDPIGSRGFLGKFLNETVSLNPSNGGKIDSAFFISPTSSNSGLVAESGVELGGSGTNGPILLTPVPSQCGRTEITMRARNGDSTTAKNRFSLMVGPVNDPPHFDFATLAGGTFVKQSLAFATNIPIGIQPYTATSSDIDGDGWTDFISLHHTGDIGGRGTPGNVTVLRNLGPGGIRFASAVRFEARYTALTPAAADLDGDGRPDLATANPASGTFSVFRNLSAPGEVLFAPRVDYTVGGYPYGLAVGDIDGDGSPDIVLNDDIGSKLVVYRNQATPGSINSGSFQDRSEFPTGPDARYPSIADLDGDGKLDVITANSSANTISLLRNISEPGKVRLTNKFDLPVGENPPIVAVGDIDGDGKPDLVAAGTGLFIYHNQSSPGTLSFAPPVELLAGTIITCPLLQDMTGNGRLDIVLTERTVGRLIVIQNRSSPGTIFPASFGAPVEFPVDGNYTYFPTTSDFDSDGRPDVIVTHDQNRGYAAVFRNQHLGDSGQITNITVLEDTGVHVRNAYVRNITAGPVNETGQLVALSVSNDNNSLFLVQPSVDRMGRLEFASATNAFGSANVTVTVRDDGGTANGGQDTFARSFTIAVNPVNDLPTVALASPADVSASGPGRRWLYRPWRPTLRDRLPGLSSLSMD
jgi:hypothetical protein